MSRRIRLAILTIGTIAWVPAILYTAGLFNSILVGAAVAIAGPALWWTIYVGYPFHCRVTSKIMMCRRVVCTIQGRARS